MKILVVVAHPDDEVLGMGGTLLKHRNAKDEIFIHILTDGHSSRLIDPSNKNSDPTIKKRLYSANKVAESLGVKDLLIDKFEDQMLDSYPHIKIVKAIESFASQILPDVVYTHFYGDLNKDHRVTFSAALTAFRPVNDKSPSQILCSEILSSTEWGISGFIPNYFVDISELINEKIELVSFYNDELKEYPHSRSLDAICYNNLRWGTQIHCKAAEAFYSLRKIWK